MIPRRLSDAVTARKLRGLVRPRDSMSTADEAGTETPISADQNPVQ